MSAEAKQRCITVAFAGGGTGGHIYPGLAVADELRALAEQKNVHLKIIWIGSLKGMDRNIVKRSGSADVFKGIPCGKLRRYASLQNFLDVFKIAAGIIAAFFVLLRAKPALLFSKGGFVSVPPCIAAKALRIPVFTHECDFTPGLATKINSRFAQKILLSYKETATYFSPAMHIRTVVTGNPVRPVFYEADKSRGLDFLGIGHAHEKPLLLVLGGSLGAQQLNQLVLDSLDWLTERCTVVHQTGAQGIEACRAAAGESYRPYDFIYAEMPDVLAAADIVLSRSGASTIWESAVCRKPMILVPLCGSGTRGDQVDNARFFAKAGAAQVLEGSDATPQKLQSALEKALANRERMAQAAGALLPKKRSARIIAELVGETCLR